MKKEVSQTKNLARLFALLLSWVLFIVYFIWGWGRNLSLFTLIWRGFLLFLVVYVVTFYYSLWIISYGENKKMEIKNEPNSRN